MKKTSERGTGFVPRQILIWKCAKPSESISQICSQNSATSFDRRVQNVLRVQNAVSWVSKFAVVHIFAAAFDWRILPPYQNTLE